MTCIVGIEHSGKVWMGGDSAAIISDSHQRMLLREPKVFINGHVLFGIAGSPRMGQILRHALTLPLHPDGKSDDAYMATDFADAVRDAFTKSGWMRTKEGAQEGGYFLAGYHGRLYLVEDDFVALTNTRGWEALGTGAPYAMGVLSFTENMAMTTEGRIEAALRAAEDLNAGVHGPFAFACL